MLPPPADDDLAGDVGAVFPSYDGRLGAFEGEPRPRQGPPHQRVAMGVARIRSQDESVARMGLHREGEAPARAQDQPSTRLSPCSPST